MKAAISLMMLAFAIGAWALAVGHLPWWCWWTHLVVGLFGASYTVIVLLKIERAR